MPQSDFKVQDVIKKGAGLTRITIESEICRRSYYYFFKHFWPVISNTPLVDNWHIEYLCNEAQLACERIMSGQHALDLIINVPPASSKSSIFSQSLNAWAWTRWPQMQFIVGSFSDHLATKNSVRTRDIILSKEYQTLFPEVKLRKDQAEKGYYLNTMGGSRYKFTTRGSITGDHAHLIIIDDPLDPLGALSESERAMTNDWLDGTISTRKVDKGTSSTILVMQRLNEDDPTAHMLSKNGNPIRHICLPAELTDDVKPSECRAFYKDGLLDIVRLNRDILNNMLIALGQYHYTGQMNQSPVAQSGNLFKTECFRPVKILPCKIKEMVRSWDKAGTAGGGCRTAGIKFAELIDNSYIILDAVIGQWEAEQREAVIKNTAILDGTSCKVIIEEEGGSGGKESAFNTVKNLRGFTVIKDRPIGDKTKRAEPLATQVNVGNVYILEGDWNKPFLDEFKMFPRGKFKDQVDASSQAFAYFNANTSIDYAKMMAPDEDIKPKPEINEQPQKPIESKPVQYKMVCGLRIPI